jgi:hypothetical protein
MRALSWIELPSIVARHFNKWVLYIGFEVPSEQSFNSDLDELFKAAPYLNIQEHLQIICDGHGYIICDSEEECRNLFDQTVGDDGPTKLNSYNGKANVYALVVSNDGISMTENT